MEEMNINVVEEVVEAVEANEVVEPVVASVAETVETTPFVENENDNSGSEPIVVDLTEGDTTGLVALVAIAGTVIAGVGYAAVWTAKKVKNSGAMEKVKNWKSDREKNKRAKVVAKLQEKREAKKAEIEELNKEIEKWVNVACETAYKEVQETETEKPVEEVKEN